MLLAGAGILNRCGYEEEAARAYEDVLKTVNLSDERIYAASVKLAEYYLKQEKLPEAREHALRARRTYNTQLSNELLDRVNEKLIDLYTGEMAEGLTDEEGRRLAQNFKMEGRAYQLIYDELQDRESEEAKQLCSTAMAASGRSALWRWRNV